MSYTLGKMEIMRGERAVAALFASGKSGFRYPLKYVWHTVEDDKKPSGIRTLFSVPKRNFKRAVRRNLLRRRMREAYRLNKAALCDKAAAAGKSVELALIYSSKEIHDFKTIEHGIKRILAEVGEHL